MLKKVVMVPCWSGFVVILLSFNFSTHYITGIIPKYKDTFFAEPGNGTHQYMLEPLPLSIIQTIAPIYALVNMLFNVKWSVWGIGEKLIFFSM